MTPIFGRRNSIPTPSENRTSEATPVEGLPAPDEGTVPVSPAAAPSPIRLPDIHEPEELWTGIDVSDEGRLPPQIARFLDIVCHCRLNIIISGGTGSGKTTLLGAMSRFIDKTERIITIEDSAELQLQQPHVIRLETRPPSLQNEGQITQRDLLRNALRMRPDRIIVGEVRGAEAFDMLQAMNTGHNGSMSTVHANSPADAMSRIENMVSMATANLSSKAILTQMASAFHLVVQIERMRDGTRRVVEISEIIGIQDGVITMVKLFEYRYRGETEHGKLDGSFESLRIRPKFMPRIQYYGLAEPFLDALGIIGG